MGVCLHNHERYIEKREIGSGATARVFQADDVKLRREVALKKIHPHLLREEAIRERFLGEARSIARLVHENIVGIYDVDDSEAFLVMELVEGCDLDSLLTGGRPLPPLLTLEIARQLFAGLSAAHASGITHRDIKPANLMIDARGCLKITDFGIAHLLDRQTLTSDGQFLGTPRYCSPEMVQGGKTQTRSDVFSAGCLLYHCATGRSPFEGENPHQTLRQVCETDPERPGNLQPMLPPFLEELILTCLRKLPEERPGAAELQASIEAFAVEWRLQLGKARLAGYLQSPEAYALEEKAQLGELFLREGRALLEKGKRVAAERSFHRAALCGMTAVASPGPVSRKFSRAPLLVLAAGIVMASGLITGFYMKHSRSQPQPIASEALEPEIGATVSTPVTQVMPDSVIPHRPHRNEANPAQVTPVSGKKLTVKTLPPTSAAPATSSGGLQVRSRPPFAQVFLGDRKIGDTPFDRVQSLPAGEYELRLEKEGCEVVRRNIRITPAETLFLAVDLPRSH